MRHNGQQGYQDAVKEILRAARAFREAVATIEELQVLGDSAASVVAFTSTTPKAFNIYQVRRFASRLNTHATYDTLHGVTQLLQTMFCFAPCQWHLSHTVRHAAWATADASRCVCSWGACCRRRGGTTSR